MAELIGVDLPELTSAVCQRQLVVGGKVIVQEQRVDQALDKRDALGTTQFIVAATSKC